jgi:hypothetical protein
VSTVDVPLKLKGIGMGEWTEHFEDFPDENPANYVDGRFDPERAKALEQQGAKVAEDQARLNKEIADIIRKHRLATSVK